ncbi:MAG TPA: C25 family cysteine peptidase, partial [Candidatus Cloacimonadota bacterium]|nr:C25 family cysteine peptidase [Candidatus Cloacimonadota bacterium]
MKRFSFLFALMVLLIANLMAEDVNVSPYQNDVRLLQSSHTNMTLELSLGNFSREAIQINGETWYDVSLKKEGLTLEAGLPQVPTISRSLIIPGTAAMQVSVINSEYVDIAMKVAPSKGNLTRNVDPATVPYSFDSFYSGTGSYPAELAELSEPFILRDYRGITVHFQPFVYFPATQTLRVYTKVQVSVAAMGTDMTNALVSAKNSYSRQFEEIYRGMFLNFQDAKYPMIGEDGRILVIKNSMFDTAIMPYVNWKRQNGYQVDVVDLSVAGPTANQIKTYIQNQYDLNNGLMFVQLMGDAPQIPTLSSGGGGSDPSFALVAGTDSYPDIYIGRFSAQTVAEMETQVFRTVQYERDLQPGADWLQRGMGIASNEGGGSQGDMGESDQAHMELIRTDLLGYGYTSVDQMYQNMGATAAQVGANINAGRGFINYVGHGSDTSWVTTGFNNTNVNNLVNDSMLPFIVSVACVNGNFV